MKKLLAVLIVLLLILAAGLAGLVLSFQIIDGQIYPRKADSLNLQGKNVSAQHIRLLQEKMPETDILWDVPFQGRTYSSDTTELKVSDLTQDIDMLVWFPELKTLDARDCSDLSQLAAIREQYPDLTILAEVGIDGRRYAYDAQEIELSSITEEELALLPVLTQLQQVTVTEGGDASKLEELQRYCQDMGIGFRIILFGSEMTEDAAEMSISGVSENQIQLLSLMPWMKALHFPEPEASAESLLMLREKLPETAVTWEKTVMGITFPQNVKEIDLTDVIALADEEEYGTKTAYEYNLANPIMGDREEIQSSVKVVDAHPLPDKTAETADLIAEVEEALTYFPELEKLTMVGAWLDNELMGQFREDHREDYKVVWSVQIGNLATRTDAKLFMPTKFMVTAGSIADWHTYNLRYCEEIVSMDVGHMSLAELDFLRYMPDLKYLDIALNHITDLSPLAECKNLVFLVMHSLSMELDYSPLLECTALEDLHIGGNPGDVSPVFQMRQLKNLWITKLSYETYMQAKAALPNTNIGYYYSGTNDGWRKLPNYFKMRDALLMFYMS